MARFKKTIMQRSFTFMEIREDFLEGDDLEVRQQSVRAARNMKSLPTRATESRPGTFYVRTLTDADDIIEIRPKTGLKFGLIINDNSFQICDPAGLIVHTENSVPWSEAAGVWAQNFREKTVIGGAGFLRELDYNDDGGWDFTEYQFADASGGEIAQAYWAFEKDHSIQPSAKNGTITVTATKPLWTADYVGLRIRYGMREIQVTEFLSSTALRGNVVNELPPSFSVEVEDSTAFRIGDIVVGADTDFKGLVISITGLTLLVATIHFFEGPSEDEELSSPFGSSKVVGVPTEVTPLPSPIWDEPLMSKHRGFPQSAAAVSGRLVLIDFPQVPDLVALSSSRGIDDFDVGAEDDDAIIRQVGDSAPRWLHAINMGDLLLLADNGVYYVPARENGVISPSTFNTVFVDEIGASEIKPVKVNDGVIFVEASGRRVSAAMLDGNVYLKWSTRPLTTFHSHQINNPKRLCGPSLGSSSDEKFMFVVNGDGTLAAMSWQGNLKDENIGFAPWDTNGEFVNVSPIFDGYWAIVDRQVTGGTVRFLERFSAEALMDCAVETQGPSAVENLSVNGEELEVNGTPLVVRTPVLSHLPGVTVSYYANGFDGGDHIVKSDGTVTGEPDISGVRQIGINFIASVKPWAVEHVESKRVGMVRVRTPRVSVSVQNTLGFQAIRNRTTTTVGGFSFGDDLSSPPELQTKVFKFSVLGNRDHPEIEFRKNRPGPFRVLAIGQEVQG